MPSRSFLFGARRAANAGFATHKIRLPFVTFSFSDDRPTAALIFFFGTHAEDVVGGEQAQTWGRGLIGS